MNKKNRFKNKLSALTPIIVLLVFLILGFCFGLWHPGWVVFLLIPIIEILISLPSNKKARWMCITIIISFIGYLTIGFALKAWHPGWLIFFLIPIVAILVE